MSKGRWDACAWADDLKVSFFREVQPTLQRQVYMNVSEAVTDANKMAYIV